jgi:hypothetical protein
MKLNRERYLTAAFALSATLGGCKLGSVSDDVAAQAAPEKPATPAKNVAPSPAQGGPEDPVVGREDDRGRGDFGSPGSGTPSTSNATRSTGTTQGLVGSKGSTLASPTKEALPSPTKEALPSPTKEAMPSPTKEVKYPSPTKEAPPPPAKEL